MSKHILILEPSQTVQALIKEKASQIEDCEIDFETDGMNFLWKLCHKETPDALFLNAKATNPNTMELIRMIKTVEYFRKLPIGLYSPGDFAFEQFYEKNCGADFFVQFNEDSFIQDLQHLLSLCSQEERPSPVQNDILRNAINQHCFAFLRHINSLDQILYDCLNLIADFSELPAISIFFLEKPEVFAYYVCADNLSKIEVQNFLRVCATDFEKLHPEIRGSSIKPKKVKSAKDLAPYRTTEIPLSSFQSIPLLSLDKKVFGTLSFVKEGNFTSQQLDLISFCAWKISLLIEDAIIIKQKNAVESRLRKAFSRFVPEQVINNLMDEAERTDKVAVGEKRSVAILFSDIRSFTNISEYNKPETVVAFLNRYFTIMVNIIKKHGGTIDKFMGDAIMALFGAPVSHEDNTRRAVAAAYEMREAVSSIPLEDLIMPKGMQFNIGIGIHYGDVIVGSIGSNDKTDYSVIGDSVNLASRLEGLTKTYGTMILVSRSVTEGIDPNEFEFRYLDNVKVKGKANSVPIYSVDRSKDEFSIEYRNSYAKGLKLYIDGIWNLAKEYFAKALNVCPQDKAAALMLDRCNEFIKNPPQNWDGAITFKTK